MFPQFCVKSFMITTFMVTAFTFGIICSFTVREKERENLQAANFHNFCFSKKASICPLLIEIISRLCKYRLLDYFYFTP